MSILSVVDTPDASDFLHHRLRSVGLDKFASVRLSGLLQLLSTGQLVLSVPSALVRGLFEAMHEPGIMPPPTVDGGTTRSCIIAMTADEVTSIGGGDKISERGKSYQYQLLGLTSQPAKGWPGIGTCWHMRVISPSLTKLRTSYGLPKQLNGNQDLSILVACRKIGVLSDNDVSKVTDEPLNILPDWEK